MDDTADTAQVIIRPPLAWGIAVMAGLVLNWLLPLPFLPAELPAGWCGAMVLVLALEGFPPDLNRRDSQGLEVSDSFGIDSPLRGG
jgi:hypothetical protein